MHFVFSTLTSDQLYTEYLPSANDLPTPGGQVLIRGGAGVMNDRIVTPHGVMTQVDDSQMAILMNVPAFREHAQNGYIKVLESEADPDKVAADMASRDGSAPLVPQDLPEGQQPKVGAVETHPAVKTATTRRR